MRKRAKSTFCQGAIALTIVACTETTGPATRALALSVCPTNTWVAFQNEGGEWTRLGGSAGGDVTIMVTDRLTLAISSTTTQSPHLSLYFIAADQAQSILGCYEPDPFQVRTLSGTLQGITAANRVQLSVGRTFTLLNTSANTFDFTYATAGTRDLVAMRHVEGADGWLVDRMIVRRAQAHADGTIPLLDFESNEAIAPAENALSWTGSGGQALVEFRGADGNMHVTQLLVVGDWGAPTMPWTIPLYSVPANRQVTGDRHILNLYSEDRSLSTSYAQPSDMTLTLGPPLMDPSFTTIANTSTRVVQAVIPWQSEYDGQLWLQLHHPGPQGPHYVTITATREHFASAPGSAPAAWQLMVPDLSAAGPPSGIGLVPGQPFDWTLTATSRRWGTPYGGGALGHIYHSAARYGTSSN